MFRFKGITKLVLLTLATLLTTTQYAIAETFYVGDTLRVGIRAEPANGGPSLAVVSSGTPLQIIERKGRHVKVRSPNGVEGWVKGAYLTRSKPAQLLLDEAITKTKRLEKQIEQLSSQKSGATNGAASGDIAKLEAEKSALQQEVNRLRNSMTNGKIDLDSGSISIVELVQTNMTPVYFLLGGLVFILSLGFLFGVTWHKHQVTKRLGGLSL